jgi:hypothetical protein
MWRRLTRELSCLPTTGPVHQRSSAFIRGKNSLLSGPPARERRVVRIGGYKRVHGIDVLVGCGVGKSARLSVQGIDSGNLGLLGWVQVLLDEPRARGLCPDGGPAA